MIFVGLDTNVLAYLAGVDRGGNDALKIAAARTLLARLKGKVRLVAPSQTLGELFAVLTRTGATRSDARAIVVQFHQTFDVAESNSSTFLAALDLAVTHRLQFWDSLIVSAAAEAGCSLLLSEDLQDGFVWRGLTIANPFAAAIHPRLAALP